MSGAWGYGRLTLDVTRGGVAAGGWVLGATRGGRWDGLLLGLSCGLHFGLWLLFLHKWPFFLCFLKIPTFTFLLTKILLSFVFNFSMQYTFNSYKIK